MAVTSNLTEFPHFSFNKIMSKKIILLLFTSLLCICSCSKRTFNSDERETYDELFKVKKIKNVNDWYFIYFHRNDSVFKVISKKPSDTEAFEKYPRIKKREQYDLTLISFEDYVNGLWVPGFEGAIVLDSITKVYLEPKNKVWMLYLSPDLEGLFYVKNKEVQTDN